MRARFTPFFSVLLFAFGSLALASSLFAQIPAGERAALIALYNATGGEKWKVKDNWLGPAGTEGTWSGVTVADGHVVELNLADNSLFGSLPEEIGDLPELRLLDLHGSVVLYPMPPIGMPITTNSLEGPLPPAIGKLKRLRTLNLRLSRMGGPIPSEIGLLSNLIELDITGNAFSSLPLELENLTSLGKLRLSGNPITSLAPLQGLTELEELEISSLRLAALPDWIGSLTKLQSLNVSYNWISQLPPGLAGLTNLRILDLSHNALQTLPVWIGNLAALEDLRLVGTGLTALPDAIGNLVKLQYLDLSNNQLTSLPASFSHLSILRVLHLYHNRLTGTPSALASLQSLEDLNLASCSLEGPIPAFIGSLGQLRVLDLAGNQLTRIPAEIGNLHLLEWVRISNNLLEGDIPTSVGGLTRLKYLDLANNHLAGPIPSGVSDMADLEVLWLDLNNLTGPLPPMGNLKRLKYVNLYMNCLEGPIPPGFGSLPELRELILGGNRLVGELPADFINLRNVFLNLNFNGLYTNDPGLESMLVDELGPYWKETQVVAPRDFTVGAAGNTWAVLIWTPIRLMDTGWPIEAFHEIYWSPDESVPYSLLTGTDGLDVSSAGVQFSGDGKSVRFKIRTVVGPHNHNPKNTVISDFSSAVVAAAPPMTRLYLPFFEAGKGSFLGVALSNLEPRSAQLALSALGPTGALLPLGRNPFDFQLAPGSQLAMLGDELFRVDGGGGPVNGWIELVADTPQIGSFFLTGKDGQLDGATALLSPARQLFFNRIFWQAKYSQGWQGTTYLSIANPASEPITVTLRLEGWPKGPVVISSSDEPRTLSIPPRGMVYKTVEEIFGSSNGSSSAYVRCTVSGGIGAVGFELIELPQALIGLPAQQSMGHTRLSSAHFAVGTGFYSSLKLSNTSREKRTVSLRATDDSGGRMPDVQVTLDPQTSQENEVLRWFRFPLAPSRDLITGSLQVIADGAGVIGDLVFGDPRDLRYASALVLQGEGATEAVFSHQVSTSDLFTGLAFYNPNQQPASVMVRVYTKEGQVTGEVVLKLGPGARISKLLTEILPAVKGQIGGYIVFQSDQPLVAQQMFGDSALTFLSAVPAVVLSHGVN